MSHLPAFRQLQNFIGEQTARKPRKKGVKPESANALTRRIVEHIRNRGHFATRLQSTGTYRDDLKKFVPSQQRLGLPDVMAVVGGRSAFIEIKVGRDTLSKDQKKAIAELQQAGAAVFIAHDFDSFQAWFQAEFLTPPFA
ncbi:VRR-NUC domain-containing protein [Spirosoma sp. BT702]|uniref:VRR-NUC domain-containing protein n=1 Tax=Spirosoma profusum TaxID=2771354 RepID=A0A927AVW2_9BACT|nr:VRR-NUC domain-containing protein [Spirosoma profusum]MBD2705372.1 VRR-NUC domain-containing protein [Spirosoma profusum]